MSTSRPQQWIDQMWLLSRQRWALSALAVATAAGASTVTSIVGGHQILPVFAIIIGLAIGAAIMPDSHAALLTIGIIIWQWLASTDDATTPWVMAIALCLLVFHTTVALLAVTPVNARVDTSILLRWFGRVGYVAIATVAMWAIVYVMDEREAPGSAVLTFVGFVTLAVLMLLARAMSRPTRSAVRDRSAPRDL